MVDILSETPPINTKDKSGTSKTTEQNISPLEERVAFIVDEAVHDSQFLTDLRESKPEDFQLVAEMITDYTYSLHKVARVGEEGDKYLFRSSQIRDYPKKAWDILGENGKYGDDPKRKLRDILEPHGSNATVAGNRITGLEKQIGKVSTEKGKLSLDDLRSLKAKAKSADAQIAGRQGSTQGANTSPSQMREIPTKPNARKIG